MTGRHDKFCAFIVALLAGFSLLPLLQPYFFASSDGLYHLFRVMEYDTVLRAGVWYPRWAPDFFYGLGMPLFNFYAPLTYYLAEVFHLLGAGYIDAMRLLLAASMALSGLGAYLYGRAFLSAPASALVAAVYMYVPYHLVNLYYRGDVAEYVAYTWFPLVLWTLTRLVQTGRLRYLLTGSLCYGALILTHNLSAFIFSGFLVIYAIAALLRYQGGLAKRWQWRPTLGRVFSLIGMVLGALALTAFFWLPAMMEKSLVDFDLLLRHYNFREQFPSLQQLFSTDLVHRYGVIFSMAEVYGYRLGLLQGIFLVVGLIALIWQRKRYWIGLQNEAIASLLVAAIALFLIIPASTWLWENVPLLSLTQFPWRLLAFVGLPSALLAGLLVELTPSRRQWLLVVLLVPVVIASSVAAMAPILSNIREADISPLGSMQFELSYGAIGTSAAAEYLPRTVKERPGNSAIALSTILGEQRGKLPGGEGAEIEAAALERGAASVVYRTNAVRAGELIADVVYFPGWLASVDGQPAGIGVDERSGLVKVAVPAGAHTVTLRFVETRLRKVADLISAVALAALLGLLVWDWRRQPWLRARLSPPRLNQETLVKVTVVVVLILAWVAAKSAYDAANAWPKAPRFPLSVNLGDEVLLEGYDLKGEETSLAGGTRVRPGESLDVTAFWRPLGNDEGQRYVPFFRLANNLGQTWAYAEAPAAYARASIEQNSTITTSLSVAVPNGTPPGIYQLEAGFVLGDGRTPLSIRRAQLVSIIPTDSNVWLGAIVVGRGRGPGPTSLGSMPAIDAPVAFGSNLRLVDVALTNGGAHKSSRPGVPLITDERSGGWQIRAGEVVHLDLLWQGVGKARDDVVVTARLASADRMLWSIRDSRPANGAYPAPFWSDGEMVRDKLELAVPPETPPGSYELQIEVISRNGPLSILDHNGVPMGPTFAADSIRVLPAAVPGEREAQKMQRRLDAKLSDGLAVRGYSLGRPELQPGEQLKVDILWGAERAVGRDLAMRLGLVDSAGTVWVSHSGRPVGDAFPTSLWREGEVLRGQYVLTLKALAPQGEADIVLELIDSRSGEFLSKITLDKVRINARSRSSSAPPQRPLVKVFDDKIRLLGFDIATEQGTVGGDVPQVNSGDVLLVTAHWQGVLEMSTNYTVFAQVLNAAGRLVAQHDGWPQGGKAPTSGWIRDEVMADEHRMIIAADLPEGEYTIIAGLYDAVTGKRLAARGDEDFVVLTPLRISSRR